MAEPSPPPVPDRLVDGDLILRPPAARDVADIVRHCNDPLTVRWTRIPTPYREQDARAFVGYAAEESREGRAVVLALEHGGRFAGTVGLHGIGGGGAELGYAVAPWARGGGLATRASRLLLEWGLGPAGLQAVTWLAAVGNWPSRRIAWRLGITISDALPGMLVAPAGPGRPEGPQDAWMGGLRAGAPLRPAHPWLETPVIGAGGGVLLRPFADADGPRLAEGLADEVTLRMTPPTVRARIAANPPDRRAANHLLSVRTGAAEGQRVSWAVADPVTDDLLGEVLLMLDRSAAAGLPGGVAEVGYWVHPDARGRRVATLACHLASRHALLPVEDGGLGLDAVTLVTTADNLASQSVATACGFRPVGTQRRASRDVGDRTVDLRRYDLLPEELGPPPAG